MTSVLTCSTVLDALRSYADDPTLVDRLDLDHPDRQRLKLGCADEVEAWLLSWPTDSRTGWHDHGMVEGAFLMLRGTLTECTWRGVVHARTVRQGSGREFGPRHIHDMVNTSGAPALSLHVYVPRLTVMTRYALNQGHLEITAAEAA